MRAITIRNPYAWAIAEAAALTALGAVPKLIENRSRRVADKHIGSDIAIHAGINWSPDGQRDPRVQAAWKAFANGIGCCRKSPDPRLAAIGDLRSGCVGHGPLRRRDVGIWMESGAVVATATLAGCHEALDTGGYTTCCAPWGDRDYPAVPKDSRNPIRRAWHLVFADVLRLRTPVPAKGQLSVPWMLPEDVAAQVQAQLDRQVAA